MPTDTTIIDRLRALHQRAIDMFDSALADKLRYVGRHTDERSIRFWVEEARKDATIGLDALAVRDAADALTAAHAARDAAEREWVELARALSQELAEAEAERLTALRERDEARAALAEMTERERQAHAKRRP